MKKILKMLSLTCFVICVLLWIPNLLFQVPSDLFLEIFIIAPIGVLLAIFSKTKWLIIGNTIMFFSFFILMGLGSIIEAIIHS